MMHAILTLYENCKQIDGIPLFTDDTFKELFQAGTTHMIYMGNILM